MKRILYIIGIFCLFNTALFGQKFVADTTDLKLVPTLNNNAVVTVLDEEFAGDYKATNTAQTPNAVTIFASTSKSGWYWVKVEDALKISFASSVTEVRKRKFGEGAVVYIGDNKYVVQNSAVSGYTTDTAVVIPTNNSKFAVLQKDKDGRYPISALQSFTPTRVENFFDFVGVRGGKVLWNTNATIEFANAEDIDVDYDIDIYSPNRDTLFVPTEPTSSLDFTVFYKALDVDFKIRGLVVRGCTDGRVPYTGDFTRVGNTVTIPSGIIDATDCGTNLCDEGRYMYFNDTVRARITAVNSSTEAEIANTDGIPTSGTATIYRDNDSYFLNTGGSTVPASKNLVTTVPLAGQRYIRTNPALDQSYLDGYIYITIDGEEYERRITEISGDTLFFSNQLPDSITTYPTTATIGKWAEIWLEDVDIAGEWANVTYWSNNIAGGDGLIHLENSTFTSNVSITSMFCNNASKNARVYAVGCNFLETGIGYYGDGNNHPTDPNGIGFYLHPHVSGIIDNCYFYGNYRDHIKWFSSSDSQTTISKYAKVSNCTFKKGSSALQFSLYETYDIINNTRGGLDISNCQGQGRIRLKGSTNISNSTFGNAEIFKPRDTAVMNLNSVTLTSLLETSGEANSPYYLNADNLRIVNTGSGITGLRAANGIWTISNSYIDIQGLNSVAVQTQGATMYISDSRIKAYHTSGNYQAIDVSGTSYGNREINVTNVEIVEGQIVLTGSASFTDEVYFRNVTYDDDKTEGVLRIIGSNIDRFDNSRERNADRDTVEYSGTELSMDKILDYEVDVNASGGNITALRVSNPTAVTGVNWYDEFKLNFVSAAVFTSGTDFSFTRTVAAGDWLILRRDNANNEWYVYQQNDADTAGNDYLTTATGYTQTQVNDTLAFYQLIPDVITAGTSRNLASSDVENIVRCTTSITLTIPLNFSAMAVEQTITVLKGFAGTNVTVTGASGVTVNGSSGGSATITGDYKAGIIYKVSTNTYEVY